MNYLLYGADTYRSRKKLHEIVDAYRAKFGPRTDLAWIDCEEGDASRLREAIATPSLFSEKKLIVCERAFMFGVAPEKIIGVLAKSKGSRDIIVILHDGAAGEETKKYIAGVMVYIDKAQEFIPLAGAPLSRWIREEAGRRGVRLAPEEIAYLGSYGADLWTIANEIEKLALSRTVEPGARRLEVGMGNSSIFALGDTFFSDRREALRHLFLLEAGGEDDKKIFFYLSGHLGTLLTLKYYSDRDQSVPQSLGIHPYVIKKTARLVHALRGDELERKLSGFFEEDLRIKTGLTTAGESLRRILFS